MTLRRFLFIAEGLLGDLLLLTPALRAVRASVPGAHISVLIVERRGPAVDGSFLLGPLPADADTPLSSNPTTDRIYVLRRQVLRTFRGLRRVRAESAVVRFLRREHFDVVVCTFPEDRFALYAMASGAPVRVGQKDQPLARLLTVTPRITKAQRGVREYYCDLVRALGIEVRSATTEYIVPGAAERWAEKTLKRVGVRAAERVVLLHPGATGDYKIWPPVRFAELARRIGRLRRVRLVICYGPLDFRVVEALRSAMEGEPLVLDTAGSLSRLAALMKRSRLCITNDSGPRHLAVAVGAPSLAFFRKHHDKEWKVYDDTPSCITISAAGRCSLCPEGACRDRIPGQEQFGSACLRMISVETAFARVTAMLRRDSGRSSSR